MGSDKVASSPKGTGLRPPFRDPLGSNPNILNYYTCNVDTIWIMVMVVICMITSIFFIKIMVWNAIYRHFGECYPMGRLFGRSATHCNASPSVQNSLPHLRKETFVGSDSDPASYPSIHHIVFRPLYDMILNILFRLQTGMTTIRNRILEHWKQADRTILDVHETVEHMRNAFYHEYIRSYL